MQAIFLQCLPIDKSMNYWVPRSVDLVTVLPHERVKVREQQNYRAIHT